MERPPTLVIQDDYIDMDLTPTATPLQPSSPRFEFQSAGAGGSKNREEAFASPADELFYKGNLLPLHLPPRLQLVQRLLQEQQVEQVQGVKRDAVEGGDDAAKVCAAKKQSWAKRLKVVRRWASREYIRSLFLTKPCDIVVDSNGSGSVSARGSALDQEEVCSHRMSFSGIIRRVRLVATKASPPPGVSPLCSSSSSSSSSTPSCGNANGFFRAAATPALKRSSSAGSEEGAIQGAIAHCKRSHLLQQGMMVSARRSVSDVVFYSVTNTPRASSVAAGEAAQERQEMCRG
ncbi:probable membrane-associated kinase regulator 3 [Phragmites australis]|uniref:probable membrane-associated kinase regulator 3 n=1 Tax=Phragmites australis TaxID=29695 RepID=UPI002D7840A3|nr:probable membrane-associated kinase regulator 3 [Phragmites australis]